MAKARRRCRPGPRSWRADPLKTFGVLLGARESHDRWLQNLASGVLYHEHRISVAFLPPHPSAMSLLLGKAEGVADAE